MNDTTVLQYVDHTLLKPTATWVQIQTLCEEALQYNTASVCIPACYVKHVGQSFPTLNVCTVVGFPLGYSSTAAKVTETKTALADGAKEIDMVINLTDVKNGDFDAVEKEIATLKGVVGKAILKVIIETCYLTEEEKIALCHAVTNAGADYIKTSTGFGTGGATLADVALFKQHIGEQVKIKAAGGVRTIEDLHAFVKAGCARIGTSGAVALFQGKETQGY